MKLSFKSGLLNDAVCRELEFESFLSRFEADLPILPDIVLLPMNGSEAGEHYGRLVRLDEQLARHGVELPAILRLCGQLRDVAHLLPFFRDQRLEAYHLFELGRFVTASIELAEHEQPFPLHHALSCCQGIRKVLQGYLDPDCGSFMLSEAEQAVREKLNALADGIDHALSNLEAAVFRETGLRLSYPLPREFEERDPVLERVRQCRLLRVDRQGRNLRIGIVPDDVVRGLQEERDSLQEAWEDLIRLKVERINRELQPFFKPFAAHLDQRKQRTLDYHYIYCKRANRLCFPKFTPEPVLNLTGAELPALKKIHGDRYQPLDLSLPAGVNLLFGANMTGKTTVLKTVYFHLLLLKAGLPLPAEQVVAMFPDQVAMLLKSSGQIASGSSGFTDELRFFSEIEDTFSVYLVDELFHSTDPLNGMKLTTAFLAGLQDRNAVFLLTSHYPEAAKIPGIRLLKMREIDLDPDPANPDSGLQQAFYGIEIVETDRGGRTDWQTDLPLRIALRFSLPEKIARNIQVYLEE